MSDPFGDSKVPSENIGTDLNFKPKIIWRCVLTLALLHLGAFYGVFLGFTKAHILTNIWMFFLLQLAEIGMTVGAHRYFAHKAFKCVYPLRVFLHICHVLSGQFSLLTWVRNHRLHHKYSDTDADPHNASRGFWYSHIGWVVVESNPLTIEKSETIDMSDLNCDPLIIFEDKYYNLVYSTIAIIVPVGVPMYFWNESFVTSMCICYMLRFMISLHETFCINSISHLIGDRNYDKSIRPTDNKLLSIILKGEGFHNFHHVFPWDYRSAEYTASYAVAPILIELWSRLGWASDLKTVKPNLIRQRKSRTGEDEKHIAKYSKVLT